MSVAGTLCFTAAVRLQIKQHNRGEREDMAKIFSRTGDGWVTELTEVELMQDIVDGTREASENGNVDPLSDEEMAHLYDLCKSVHKITGVGKGREVITTYDGPTIEIRHAGIIANRQVALQMFERCFGADTIEFSHVDYSYKPSKSVVHEDLPLFEQAQLLMVIPLFYGAMPNLGLYTYPDGPMPNPGELLPLGKIKEAREAYEQAVELAVKDMVYVASSFYEAGADGINLDTVGASGDPDFKAALLVTEKLKAKYPDICIEMGMAGEFVLGTHGAITHDGQRLAGLYPHEQLKVAQKSGVRIFGPVVNTLTNKTIPWNLSRAVTLTKACVACADIPVHGNMGMGVGGLPVCETLPLDMLTVAAKAMVEITQLDGL
jgi:dimethylamine--corrinoid protein Co-methyltransferase